MPLSMAAAADELPYEGCRGDMIGRQRQEVAQKIQKPFRFSIFRAVLWHPE